MSYGPELLLVGAVAAVGVLHTVVPDHWVPITLIARQRGWSRAETAWAAARAGIGHVGSTMAIAVIVWIAGVAVAQRFGGVVDAASSLGLIAFGAWIAASAWRDLRRQGGHGHGHDHGHPSLGIHGPEWQKLRIGNALLEISIFEAGVPPRFRISGADAERVAAETVRADGTRQRFFFANHGTYWESVEEIPEPHRFRLRVTVERGGPAHSGETVFSEHDHGGGPEHVHVHGHDPVPAPADDPLYAPLRGEAAPITRHRHTHRHGCSVHVHWHDHLPATSHAVTVATDGPPPTHEHRHKTTARTALLLVLGSSPMVEGIPAFFAAGRYGAGLTLVFALSTIATYVLLCVFSTAGLQRFEFGAVERYGEVLSGGFIALVGLAFGIWPVL
jgi:nickel/cobalt transporter (NicO) family protein